MCVVEDSPQKTKLQWDGICIFENIRNFSEHFPLEHRQHFREHWVKIDYTKAALQMTLADDPDCSRSGTRPGAYPVHPNLRTRVYSKPITWVIRRRTILNQGASLILQILEDRRSLIQTINIPHYRMKTGLTQTTSNWENWFCE